MVTLEFSQKVEGPLADCVRFQMEGVVVFERALKSWTGDTVAVKKGDRTWLVQRTRYRKVRVLTEAV